MEFKEGCFRLDSYGIFYGGFRNRVTLTTKIDPSRRRLDIFQRRTTKFRVRKYYCIVDKGGFLGTSKSKD